MPALPEIAWSRQDYEAMQRAARTIDLTGDNDESRPSHGDLAYRSRRRLRRSNPAPPPKEEPASDDEEVDYDEALYRKFYL